MEKLKEYKSKRNFNNTTEPKESLNRKKNIFCVQHHLASHDHYDFRLEYNGVMLSFAVPKGPSMNPKQKRLAVMVEDHPTDYADFEGVIPKGEYGGGTVMLWDFGLYKKVEDFKNGLKRGSLKFKLFGKRLKGGFALVRLKDGKNWLLIKENDEYVTTKDITKIFTTSIKTRKTMSQISNYMPQKIGIMLATKVNKIPDDENFLYEIKYDGYRIICFCENGNIKLESRNGKDYTKVFEMVAKDMQKLAKNQNLIFDGEVIAVNENGCSDFGLLQAFAKNRAKIAIKYMIFDVIFEKKSRFA